MISICPPYPQDTSIKVSPHSLDHFKAHILPSKLDVGVLLCALYVFSNEPEILCLLCERRQHLLGVYTCILEGVRAIDQECINQSEQLYI